MKNLISKFFTAAAILVSAQAVEAQSKLPTEDDYYKIITIPTPEGVLLEVGGVATLPDGRIALSTRCRHDSSFGEGVSIPRFEEWREAEIAVTITYCARRTDANVTAGG